MTDALTAERFTERLDALASPAERDKYKRYFRFGDDELYQLYLRRHDRVNNWDLVDLAARDVVGAYLRDRPRGILYALARSPFWPERRTAVVATAYFIRDGDLDDTFAIAGLLLDDPHDLVHKATGWMLRYAGSKDRAPLLGFLDAHASVMPRAMLRAAIEHLDPELRRHYLGLGKTAAGG